MKELIIKALSEAIIVLDKQVPQTKKQTKSISIIDVNPLDIPSFMKSNNIPENAYFDGRDNGYDAWDDILLSWDIDVHTTDEEKLTYKRKRFSDIAFRYVNDSLTDNGYKRIGFNSRLLKQFKNTSVYDMFINKDFDRLVEHYSLYFTKK